MAGGHEEKRGVRRKDLVYLMGVGTEKNWYSVCVWGGTEKCDPPQGPGGSTEKKGN